MIPRKKNWGSPGFTMLEVMIALAILAVSLAAIAGANNASAVGELQSHKLFVASQLMRGIVLDIEEEYQVEGFPENDRENEDCEVPDPWDRTYDCEYTLEGLETDAEVLSQLAQSGMGGIFGGMEGGGGAPNMDQLRQSGVDASKMLALAPLFGPEGDELIATCGINVQAMLTSLMGAAQFFPEIVRQAARQTRKLSIRLSFRQSPQSERVLEIETFIVAIPREEIKRADEIQKLQDSGLLPVGGNNDPLPSGGRR